MIAIFVTLHTARGELEKNNWHSLNASTVLVAVLKKQLWRLEVKQSTSGRQCFILSFKIAGTASNSNFMPKYRFAKSTPTPWPKESYPQQPDSIFVFATQWCWQDILFSDLIQYEIRSVPIRRMKFIRSRRMDAQQDTLQSLASAIVQA